MSNNQKNNQSIEDTTNESTLNQTNNVTNNTTNITDDTSSQSIFTLENVGILVISFLIGFLLMVIVFLLRK